MFKHLCAPILIDSAQLLQIQLLDHENGQPVIPILQKQLDDALGLELLQLLEGDRSGEIRRVAHLSQDDRVFDQVDVLVRVELGRVAELLGE